MGACEHSRLNRLQTLDEVGEVINLLVVHWDAACYPSLSFVLIKGFKPRIKVCSNKELVLLPILIF